MREQEEGRAAAERVKAVREGLAGQTTLGGTSPGVESLSAISRGRRGLKTLLGAG